MASVRMSLSLIVSLALLLNVATSAAGGGSARDKPAGLGWKEDWNALINFEHNDEKKDNPSPQEVFETLNRLAAPFKHERSISSDIDRGLKERIVELSKTAKMDIEQCTGDHMKYIIGHLKDADHTYPLRRFVRHYGPNFLKMCAESVSKKLKENLVKMESAHKSDVEKFADKFGQVRGWNDIDKSSDIDPYELIELRKRLADTVQSLLLEESDEMSAAAGNMANQEFFERHVIEPCRAWIDATGGLLRDYRILDRYINEGSTVIRKSVSCQFAVNNKKLVPREPEKKLPPKRWGLFSSCLGGKCIA